MDLNQFVAKYNGKWVKNGGLSQCVALCRQYFDDVLGIPQFPQIIGAYQIYDIVSDKDFTKVLNTQTGVPLRGSIIIWKKEYGGNGHVGIVLDADVNGILVFSQNHTGNLDPCEIVSYSYNLVKGWLISKKESEDIMRYDLFRDPSGAIYERLNNYALVHIPDPDFLKRYYGSNPAITQVDDIWSVGWIAEDPRPLEAEIESLETQVTALTQESNGLRKQTDTLTKDKSALGLKLVTADAKRSELEDKIDGLTTDVATEKKAKTDCMAQIGNSLKPTTPNNTFIENLKNLIGRIFKK